MDKKMAMEKSISPTPAPTLANLIKEKLKERVDYIIQMEIFLLATGETIKPMVMANI